MNGMHLLVDRRPPFLLHEFIDTAFPTALEWCENSQSCESCEKIPSFEEKCQSGQRIHPSDRESLLGSEHLPQAREEATLINSAE